MNRLIIFYLIFLSVSSFSNEKELKRYYKAKQCFELFSHPKDVSSLWEGVKKSAKEYKDDFKEHGAKRFFIKPIKGESPSNVERKFKGLVIHDPEYHNLRWWMDLERKGYQFFPRKFSKIVFKKEYEVAPFRAIEHYLNKTLYSKKWELTIPSSMIITMPPVLFFWGGLYIGSDYLSDIVKDRREMKKAMKRVNEDYRYQEIKKQLDDGVFTKDMAILESIDLRGTLKLYHEFIQEQASLGVEIDSKKLSSYFTQNESLRVVFQSLFKRTFSYMNPDFYNEKIQDFNEKKQMNFDLLHELIVINHMKIINQSLIEDSFKRGDIKILKDYADDEFVKEVLSYRDKGIPESLISYYLMNDIDNIARFKELDVMGVKYKRPDDSSKAIDLNFTRSFILKKLEENFLSLNK